MSKQIFLKCRITKAYEVAYPNPIKLEVGATLHSFEEKKTEWEGWLWCTNSQKISGWVPKSYLRVNNGVATALCDYDATELTVETGDQLIVEKEESGWLWCVTNDGSKGWVPKENTEAVS